MSNMSEQNIKKKSKRPFVTMFVKIIYDEDATYSRHQAMAITEAKFLYQYLRMRGCKPVYTDLTEKEGIFRLRFVSRDESNIIAEINRLAVEHEWDVRNRLEDFDAN